MTEHHLEFLSLKGGCTGSSESTLVKMLFCWKSHVMAQLFDKGMINEDWNLISLSIRQFLKLIIFSNCCPRDLHFL